jgi:hypothetical protein
LLVLLRCAFKIHLAMAAAEYSLCGNVDLNDVIEPKHPALGLSSRKWTRICFMNALTEPLFAELPLTFRSARFVWDKWAETKRGQVEFTINCGPVAKDVPVVLTLDSSANLPPDWDTTFTQKTLLRPYRESIDFWGSVASMQIANWDLISSDPFGYLITLTLTLTGTDKKIHPKVVETLDLLLTIFVELNWIATSNTPWRLALGFPHFWVAHAAKFEVYWKYNLGPTNKQEPYKLAICVLFQDPRFFVTVKRLLGEFELHFLPVRCLQLLSDLPAKDGVASPFFHDIFQNVVDVMTDVCVETWDFMEAVIRMNFPKLSRVVCNRFQQPHATFRLAQFLLNHRNDVTFTGFPTGAENYLTNAKAMRAFIEAAAPVMLTFIQTATHKQRVKAMPIVHGFFNWSLFERHVVHIIDRFVHGRDVLHLTPFRNKFCIIEEQACASYSSPGARLSICDL